MVFEFIAELAQVKICVLGNMGDIYYVVRETSQRYRGSDWVVLALGYRLALGVATSIFFFFTRHFLASTVAKFAFNGLNAFNTNTLPIKRANMGMGIHCQT